MRKCFTAILLVIILSFINVYAQFRMNKIVEKDEKSYLSNTIVVKLKSAPAGTIGKSVNLNSALAKRMEAFSMVRAEKAFSTRYSSPLNNVVVIQYAEDVDPYVVAAKLKEAGDVEWAEPKFIRKVDYTPNDPSFTNQYALGRISAFEAWDISQGDESIIIAIIDTGVDWDHPDLSPNIWSNSNEIPGNGVDDDGNGYVDDIRGWDFGGLNGTPDNNPMEDRPVHGTHVAGIAAAATDNGTGISSIGFNSTLMPVKVVRDDLRNDQGQPYIVYGNEGIIYAVDNGARIINCSFGGSGYSILDQEVMDYASSHNSLIVAASGNDDSEVLQYPASYRGVLSVASTDRNDLRSSFSNYGTEVDVSAPGSSIYSTWQNDTYSSQSGTSMSSPLVAGLAALVAQRFPGYTAGQIAEQIRVNTDDIYSSNPNYNMKLGKGRINAFKALSNTSSVSVRGIEFEVNDEGDGDGIFEGGETISIGIRFVNYLNPTTALNISLQSPSAQAIVQNGSFNAGSAAILDTFDNFSSRFTVTLSPSLPLDTELLFVLNFSDGSYTDFQMFKTIANQTYATQSGNNISLTIGSNGTLAFNDYPENLNGNGFHYLDGENLLFEGALILGTSASKVSDAARNSNGGDAQVKDFFVTQPFILDIPGERADQQGHAVFTDDNAGSNKIGITVNFYSYTFSSEDDENYIMLEYRLTNTTQSEISNLYTGLFFDWDMVEGSGEDDITSYDDAGKFGYVYHPGGNPDTYVGTALISSENYGFWAIANAGDSNFEIYDGFSDAEKWQAISSGVGKTQAGPTDISHVISGGPFTIPAGETVPVAFAVAAGPGLEELRQIVAAAREQYNIVSDVEDNTEVPLTYSLAQNYPNPFNPVTNFEFRTADLGLVTVKVYDLLGREVAVLVNEEKPAGTYNIRFDASQLSSGVYYYRLTAGNYTETRKMMLLK